MTILSANFRTINLFLYGPLPKRDPEPDSQASMHQTGGKSHLSHDPEILNRAAPVAQPPVGVGHNHRQQSWTGKQSSPYFAIKIKRAKEWPDYSFEQKTI
jgi:hypothetical protein